MTLKPPDSSTGTLLSVSDIEDQLSGFSSVDSFIDTTSTFEAAVEAAIVDATATNTRAGVVSFGQGTTYSLTNRAIRLAPSLIGLELVFNGCKIVSNTTAKGRSFDLWRTADYQTFQKITFTGPLTVDGNNVATAFNQHCVLGNLIDGAWTNRINVDGLTIRDVTAINVETSTGAASRHLISIGSNQLGGAEPQTSLKNILIENCDFTAGGNTGVAIMGTGTTAANVLIDNVTLRRVRHDSIRTPTVFHADANYQIGGYGHGGTYTIESCTGTNSADVGIEADGAQHLHVENTTLTDSWSGMFYSTNFNSPDNVASQVHTFRNCHAVIKNLNPASGGATSSGFIVGHSTASAAVGTYVMEKCSFRSAATTLQANAPVVQALTKVSNFVIRDFVVDMPSINYTPGTSQFPTLIDFRPTTNCRLIVDGIQFKLAGTGNGNLNIKWFRVASTAARLWFNIKNLSFDGNITGMGNAGNKMVYVGDTGAGTISGSISGFRLVSWAGGDTLPVRITFGAVAFVTLTRVHIDDCDFLSTMGGSEISFDDATARTKTSMGKGIVWGSNLGNPPTIASAATLSVPAIPSVFISGNTNITAITALPPDTVIALKFAGTPTVTAGASIKLFGGVNFVATADDTLTLMCDGTNWWEVARSVNA